MSLLRSTLPATSFLRFASSTSSRQARRHASSVVLIEHKGGKMNEGVLNAVTAAKGLGGDVSSWQWISRGSLLSHRFLAEQLAGRIQTFRDPRYAIFKLTYKYKYKRAIFDPITGLSSHLIYLFRGRPDPPSSQEDSRVKESLRRKG